MTARPDPLAVDVLRDLVMALDSTFISAWQSTAGWQKQLDAAREYLIDHYPFGDAK